MTDLLISKRILVTDAFGRPKIGLGPGTAYELMKNYFPLAQEKIRIASAYFTTSGYKLARKFIPDNVKLWILVGKEDGRNVVQTVIEDILEDNAHPEEDLWETINDLVAKLRAGDLQIVDARAMQDPFHCKFYIVDNKILLHGSSNFSRRGLLQSIEQVGTTKEQDEIDEFTAGFEHYYQTASPLTERLIEILEELLKLKSPFDIYLKTLLVLNILPDHEIREKGHRPIYYQRAVVARMLRQIDAWQSSILVAATGLGKTVMGAEVALQLHARGEIKRVILLSPAGNVQEEWCTQLEARDIPHVSFTNTILFHENTDKNSLNQVSRLDRQLADSDKNTLIIVDEAHVFRNQLLVHRRKGYNSRVIERIGTAVNEKKARIVLLTATPYSTSVVNLNSLLALIPHLGIKDFWGEQEALVVKKVTEFVQLPMCTVIGLPHVIKLAQKRGDLEADGRIFINFPDRRRYMPKKLNLRTIHYELPIDGLFQNAWNANCFDQLKRARQWVIEEKSRGANDMFQASIDYIRNTTVDAWLSSPTALRIAVAKNLLTPDPIGTNDVLWPAETNLQPIGKEETSPDDVLKDENKPYKTLLKMSLKERTSYLLPLLDGLKTIESSPEIDAKLIELRNILKERCQNGGKALVFTTLHATASYLCKNISDMLPELRVDVTVEGKSLKPMKERQRMQRSFAPKANRVNIDEEDMLDVLIVTDADGVGVNLQDADTVISYDLPREADKIIQRVGRVLRPTEDREREVYLYVLYPMSDIPDPEMKNVMNKVMDRFNRVTHRHDSAQMILNSPVMPTGSVENSENTEQVIHLDREVDVNALLEKNGDILAQFSSEGDTSRAIQHQAVLEETRNKERSQKLGENISSARNYDSANILVYALILDGSTKRHITLLYNHSKKEFLNKEETEILDLLACEEDASPALVKTEDVEKLVNRVVRKWCKMQDKSLDTVKKVCSLVLIPRDNDLRVFLDRFLSELDDTDTSQ